MSERRIEVDYQDAINIHKCGDCGAWQLWDDSFDGDRLLYDGKRHDPSCVPGKLERAWSHIEFGEHGVQAKRPNPVELNNILLDHYEQQEA